MRYHCEHCAKFSRTELLKRRVKSDPCGYIIAALLILSQAGCVYGVVRVLY